MPRLGNFLKTKLSRKAEGATLAHWRGGGLKYSCCGKFYTGIAGFSSLAD